jgi:hypothetical protein
MAIQLSGVDVITDARELKIRSADDDVKEILRYALREDNDFLEIQDSSGNPIHVYYGAG